MNALSFLLSTLYTFANPLKSSDKILFYKRCKHLTNISILDEALKERNKQKL